MRKLIPILIALFVALCLAGCAKQQMQRQLRQSSMQVESPAPLYVDDVAYPDDGEKLANAFVFESSCNGLTMVRDRTSSGDDKLKVLHAEHWLIIFTCNIGGCGGGMNMFRGKNVGTQIAIHGETPGRAAQQICSVMSGKGGKVL
jgi:hypothetical protein